MSMYNHSKCVDHLKFLRESVNFEMEEERFRFLFRLTIYINVWDGQLLNPLEIFKPEEIECLLSDSVKRVGGAFVSFVARSGYKDEPKLDTDGKPILVRTTPVHRAARFGYARILKDLFAIYNRFDLNYTDESGLTHFQAACNFGCNEVAKKFLEFGQDPNGRALQSANPLLHMALWHEKKETAELLLGAGADPNLANEDGLTPLHFIVKKNEFRGYSPMKMLFELSHDRYKPVRIDARDKLGRTPLESAVASFEPDTVSELLYYGAELSKFAFPSESHFDEYFERHEKYDASFESAWQRYFTLEKLTNIVKSLEDKGYELDGKDILTIMKIFAKLRLFRKTPYLDERSCSSKKYVDWAKNFTLNSSLAKLHDLMQLPLEEAKKLFTFQDYLDVKRSSVKELDQKLLHRACIIHLYEILFRRFFRPCAMEYFLELTQYQLPILCCEKIFDTLMNEDLWRIYLAATDQSS